MQFRRIVALAVGVVALGAFTPAVAQAASPPNPSIVATPGAVTVGQTVTADLHLTNDPDGDLDHCVVDWWDGSPQVTVPGCSTNPTHTYATAGTYTPAVDAFDATGAHAFNFGRVVVTDARNDVAFGANVHQRTGETFNSALLRQDGEYAPKAERLFFSGLPSTSCSESRNALANQRPSIVSFKDAPTTVSAGTDDATINAWLSCFTRPTRVTYYHEPEDNFTSATAKAQYRAAWQHFSALVLAHPNHANLIREIIYGDWTWASASGRNALDWYPGDAYVDTIGADQYNFNENNASSTDDQTEAQHLAARPSLAFAVSHGKQYDVPELGYDDPATRPAFLRDLGAYLRDPSRNVGIVTYFDGGSDTVNGGAGNHQLLDTASQDAWKDVCAS